MKNRKSVFILSFLLILCFIPFVKSDPSFIVIAPKRDQLFTVGDNVISWEPPIPENVSHVRIELFKGIDYIKAIDTWADNTGEFIWTLNETDPYAYGKDYKIKISSSIWVEIYGWSESFCINLHPVDPVDSDPIDIDIDTLSIIIIIVLLVIVIVIYYDKKTHKIQKWIRKIKKKKLNIDRMKSKIIRCDYCDLENSHGSLICKYCGTKLLKENKDGEK